MAGNRVSVIIVNWNGKKWLKACLDSLANQTYKDYEVLFVDNASTDESVRFVESNYPEVIIIKNTANDGFARGNNIALPYANGEYIILLNNDTEVEEDFIERFMGATKISNLGCAQAKLVQLSDTDEIDSCGSFWTSSTLLYHYGNGKDSNDKKYNQPMQVFTAKGAAILIPRRVIDEVGLFDEDFWCYYEETDFCHRARIAGYDSWYYPKVTVRHAGGNTSLAFKNDLIQFHNFKNKMLSFLKNFQTHQLLFIIPVYIGVNLALALVWLLTGKPQHTLALSKAFWWNLVNFGNTMKKRRYVQARRQVADREINRQVKRNPRFAYYLTLFNGRLKTYEDQSIR